MEFRFIRHSDGRVFHFDPVAGTIGAWVTDPADIQGNILQGADNPYGGGGPEVIQAHLDAAIEAALGSLAPRRQWSSRADRRLALVP